MCDVDKQNEKNHEGMAFKTAFYFWLRKARYISFYSFIYSLFIYISCIIAIKKLKIENQ